MPAGLQGKTIDDVEIGAPLGRSWILLGGLIPVDFDDLRLVELEPGRRFLERSRTLTFSLWQHERVVEPEGEGSCRVTDGSASSFARRLPGCRACRSSHGRSSPPFFGIVIGGWRAITPRCGAIHTAWRTAATRSRSPTSRELPLGPEKPQSS